MPDYEKLYHIMSQATAQAMQTLAEAHWKCEELSLDARGRAELGRISGGKDSGLGDSGKEPDGDKTSPEG